MTFQGVGTWHPPPGEGLKGILSVAMVVPEWDRSIFSGVDSMVVGCGQEFVWRTSNQTRSSTNPDSRTPNFTNGHKLSMRFRSRHCQRLVHRYATLSKSPPIGSLYQDIFVAG